MVQLRTIKNPEQRNIGKAALDVLIEDMFL